jgi:hypothetical protein
MMQRLSTRVAVQRSLRREHDGLIADLQAFKRARMVGANPLPDPASSCDLCATPIPERCLAVLDCRPFHIACANRVLRDEMAALGAFTELAVRRTANLIERTAHLVRESRALCG